VGLRPRARDFRASKVKGKPCPAGEGQGQDLALRAKVKGKTLPCGRRLKEELGLAIGGT
jgi:hypothetical protein